MSLKYRIRLEDNRVIGPLTPEEIAEFFEKSPLTGKEFCQQFPIGPWKQLSEFSHIVNCLKVGIEEPPGSAVDRSELTGKTHVTIKDYSRSDIGSLKEFKFGNDVKIDVNYRELEKKYLDEKAIRDSELDKTRIAKPHLKSSPDLDKTIVLKRDIPESESSFKITAENKIINTEIDEATLPDHRLTSSITPPAKDLVNQATRFLDINEVLPAINAELSASEIDFERQAKVEENAARFKNKSADQKQKKAGTLSSDEEIDFDVSEKKKIKNKSKSKMSWVALVAFVGISYIFLFDDNGPSRPLASQLSIVFPLTKSEENISKSHVLIKDARTLYGQNTYSARKQSAYLYRESVENKFTDNPAFAELIRVDAELYENAKNRAEAGNAIFKLIKIADKLLYSDPIAVEGAAYFFGQINKSPTGILTIKNYLRTGSKATPKLMGYYLELLLNSGDFEEAKKTYENLLKNPKRPFEVYKSLARFNEINDNVAEAQNMIDEGLKYYPSNVMLLLKSCEYALKNEQYKKAEDLLKKIKELNFEESPVYLSMYFKYYGMFLASKGKEKEAAIMFKKSLELKEDEDLRMKLASLEVSGGKLSQKLILDSKIITLLKKGKEEIKKRNWYLATSLISEAVEADQTFLPSLLLLADLQINQGLYDAAFHSLQLARDKDPLNFVVIEKLITTYLRAFKIDEAQKALIESQQTKFKDTAAYAYLYGYLFELKGNIKLSYKYYQEAYRRNPLDDKILYRLANLYFKQKQMADAKKSLADAMFLDPLNSEYQSLYADILHDQDGPDVAIGYLRDILTDKGEDPKLLASITSIYYRSGQTKEFKKYYQKIQSLSKKDEGLYEFLINSSKLDQSYGDFESYSLELLKMAPGNLKVRMDLAVYYLDTKKNIAASMDQLQEIKTRLPSYPNVYYLLAKAYILQSDLKKAKEMAETELKQNPTLDSAQFIVGEVHRVSKEYREAVTYFEKAISLNPKSMEALMSLGWIRLNQNLGSEALDLYMRAQKLEPNNAEIYRQLGYVYKALGQRSMAKEKFEDYFKLNPGAIDRAQIEAIIKQL